MPRKKVVPVSQVDPEPIEEPATEPVPEQPVDRMTELESKFDKLLDLVSEVLKKNEPEAKVRSSAEQQETRDAELSDTDFLTTVPNSWKRAAETILGKDFTFKVEETSGGNFMLYVYTPPHLDRRPTTDSGSRDVSTGLVRRASAMQDVETWCALIRDNVKKHFPEYKA